MPLNMVHRLTQGQDLVCLSSGSCLWIKLTLRTGLDRIVQFFLNLPNIRLAAAFPRDPGRIAP
jgi:hypothetical protein